MNRTQLPTLLVGILIVLALSTAARAQDEPKSYPLLCRGTSDLKLTESGSVMMLEFKKGTRPAKSGLAPGECSWMDRGMREAEPGLVQQGSASVTSGWSMVLTGKKSLDKGWRYALKDPDKYWLFQVFYYPEVSAGPYSSRAALYVTGSEPYSTIDIADSAPSQQAGVPVVKVDPRVMAAETTRLPTLEPDTNRAGQDYKSFETDGEPDSCQRACADDLNCKAFTYVKRGVQRSRAMCWLKSGVPAASKSECCVSGVKRTAPSSAARPARP